MRIPNLTTVPSSERAPMSRVETEMFLACTMLSSEGKLDPVPAAELPDAIGKLFDSKLTEDYVSQIFLKRLTLSDVLYDPCVAAFMCILPDRPGMAVLWAWTLYDRTRELGRPYTMGDLTNDFPMGFPTKEGMEKAWDRQKGYTQDPPVKCDNMLDKAEPWKTEVAAA
jgi:hypothetical protein